MVSAAHAILGQFAGEVVRCPNAIVLSVTDALNDSFGVSVQSGNGVGIGTFHGKSIPVVLDDIKSAVFIDALAKVNAFAQARLT